MKLSTQNLTRLEIFNDTDGPQESARITPAETPLPPLGQPETDSHGLRHPMRKTYVDRSDIDTLCHELRRVKEEIEKLREFEYAIRFALNDLSEGTNKTRRVIGQRYEAKIVDQDDYWLQSTLKDCVSQFPQFASTYLRISQYAPNMREVKKLENATGHPELVEFRDLLFSAREPSKAPPTVTITEIG